MKLSKNKLLIALASLIIFGGVGFLAARSMAAKNQILVHHVSLTDQGAQPNAVAVVKGGYVQFDTKDGKQHSMSQGKGAHEVHHEAHSEVHEHQAYGKESGVFGPSEAYKVQFHQTGTFNFHDHLNPKLSITVVVYEPGSK